MKTFAAAFLVTILFTSPVHADDRVPRAQASFASAVEAYKKGDYEGAVRLNRDVLAAGIESAAIHFNLGNSYLRARQIGRSVASYLRAERLAPRDGDIKANLGYVRGLVNGPAAVDKRPLWASPFEQVAVDELRWSALIIFMLTATAVLIGLYAGLKRRKVAWWALIGGILLVYVVIGLFTRAVEETGRGVALERADVRFEPSPQATTYFKLLEGTELRVLREKDGWLKVERLDHKAGWVPVSAVEKI
jgi:tetratricopeptide (TPR) repeat protein